MNAIPKDGRRLESLMEWVLSGQVVADIGAGDGLLSLEILRRQRPQRVIATEAKEGPHRRLEEGLRGVKGAEVRFGCGLEPLEAGEAGVIVVAGMGVKRIMEILARSPEVARGARRMVLQPMNDAGPLREMLLSEGFPWAFEDLAYEKGHFYEILVTDSYFPSMGWDPIADPLGPTLTRRADDLAASYRRRVLKRLVREREARRRAGLASPAIDDLIRRIAGEGDERAGR